MHNNNGEPGAYAVPVVIESMDAEDAQARSLAITDNKRFVVRGFLLSLAGVAAYGCATLTTPDVDQRLVLVSLSVVGTGFIVWLIGTVRYFNQAIDNGDPDAVL